MNTCKYCGKPLTLTPEYDTCMECQGRIMREATMPKNSFTTNLKKLSMNIYDEALKEISKDFGLDDDDIIVKALKRAKKVEELLGLYRLEKETKEKYHTSGSLYVMQHVLDELREIAEEINLKEKELEEMKWTQY